MKLYNLKLTSPHKGDCVVFATKATKAGTTQGFPYVQGDYLVSNEDKLVSAVPYNPSKFESMYEVKKS